MRLCTQVTTYFVHSTYPMMYENIVYGLLDLVCGHHAMSHRPLKFILCLTQHVVICHYCSFKSIRIHRSSLAVSSVDTVNCPDVDTYVRKKLSRRPSRGDSNAVNVQSVTVSMLRK